MNTTLPVTQAAAHLADGWNLRPMAYRLALLADDLNALTSHLGHVPTGAEVIAHERAVQEALAAGIMLNTAATCAAEHIAQGWTIGSAAYSIGVYTGDREALADALGREVDCGEAMDFEAMVRSAIDAARAAAE